MEIYLIKNALSSTFGSLVELFLRILVAAACGAIIGLERTKRQKDAGLRTHLLLAVGCATLVIISKYGFLDVAELPNAEFFKTDLSRVTSTILSGIGFIGAGVIFVRGTSIRGLTTASGIWSALAVSISIGAGLYEVGIFVTIVVVMAQIILHKYYPSVENITLTKLNLKIKNSEDNIDKIMKIFNQYNIKVNSISTKHTENEMVLMSLSIGSKKGFDVEKVYLDLEHSFIAQEISISDESEK